MVGISVQVRFVKLYNKWFMDLPSVYVEMVLGADEMLNIIAKGKEEIVALMTTDRCTTHDVELTLTEGQEEDDYGRTYGAEIYNEKHIGIMGMLVWLGPEIEQLFKEFPRKIYILI